MPHSPEPWRTGWEISSQVALEDANGKTIGIMGRRGAIVLPGHAQQDPPDANIQRIIACVNACARIPTEELQQHGKLAFHRQVQRELELSLQRRAGELEYADMQQIDAGD